MPATEADEMAEDFTELVNDLAYAKTFYPSSKITRFINGQASKIYLKIFRNKKEEVNRIFRFWKIDLPLIVRKYHRVIFFTALLFCIFFFVGFFSSKHDENFTRYVLTDGYVDTTIQNIEDKNPFGIYQSDGAFISWLEIMFNNIRVAIKYFFEGIVFGYFTIRGVIANGVMVGVFYEIFFSRGLGLQWGLAVMIHGTLELWSLVISSTGGIILGMGFLFPGTRKRIDSLKIAAKDGVKLLVGIIPFYMVAAFFEGFVTRHYKMHWSLNVLILLASVFLIVWYFIIYPVRLSKKLAAENKQAA
jgi:uncharacterized membrane protein SpoIIM required for sporulation